MRPLCQVFSLTEGTRQLIRRRRNDIDQRRLATKLSFTFCIDAHAVYVQARFTSGDRRDARYYHTLRNIRTKRAPALVNFFCTSSPEKRENLFAVIDGLFLSIC